LLKKTITYEDFNGDSVTEDFFFHLSKAELVELELSHKGGLSEALQRIIATDDGKEIVAEFKNIILTAYGQRSPDGKRFIKNQTLREEFESTEAYSTLFMELVTDTDAAIKFINGVIPAGMAEEAAELTRNSDAGKPDIPPVQTVPEPVEKRTVSRTELIEMSTEEYRELSAKIARGEVTIEMT
jgi:hypothetical protein